MSPLRTHTHQEENPYPQGCRHVCLPRTHTHQERLRDDLREPIHTCVPFGIITTLVAPVAGRPPDHYYRDLGILHSRCDQLSLALAESRWGGRSTVIASPRVAPPSDAPCHPRPDSSSLQGLCLSPWLGPSHSSRFSKERYHEPFVPGARYSDNRRLRSRESPSPTSGSRLQGIANDFASEDLACHPGLFLPLKIFIVQATPPAILLIAVAFQRSAITIRSFLAPDLATIGDSVQESPSPKQVGVAFKGFPPLHSEWFRFKGFPFSK